MKLWRCVWVALATLATVPTVTYSAGVFQDPSFRAGLFFGHPRPSFSAKIISTNRDALDANLFVVGGWFPVRDRVAVGIEQPFVSIAGADGVNSGAGDTRAALRFSIVGGKSSEVAGYIASAVGTGNDRLFPFSSKSIDLTLGLAATDTLGATMYWLGASATRVWRQFEGLPAAITNDNHVSLDAGLGVNVRLASAGRRPDGTTVPQALVLRSGGTFHSYSGDADRFVLFGEAGWQRDLLTATVGAIAEAGDDAARLLDLGAYLGFRVVY